MEHVHTSQHFYDTTDEPNDVHFVPYLSLEQRWQQLRAEQELKQIDW